MVFFIVLLVATGTLRTIVRNRDWRSRDSLLRAGLETLPHNAKMHYNYANFLRDSKRPELAKLHYHTALSYTEARQHYENDSNQEVMQDEKVYAVDMQKVLLLPKMSTKESFFVGRIQ
ncbi:unnamed protein product [Acanthoscelides obtectus]|uniref:Uncharacterized protein n=1 Tax=Acanthoscelides obtectus TaxID=200917 RepID=A0A9P0Q5X3_ACAOB|nr:unnamed protein product [Acanthoscelides obtectus]CAK1687829.1 Transmembrane and TPR repeat-containing protein 1 [Acanthoscelides obtectus]